MTASAPARTATQRAAHILMATWSVLAALGAVWWMVDPDALFFSLGSIASLIVTVPMARREFALTSPWSLIALTVYVGCGLRGLALSAGVETTSRTLDQLFLLGREPDYFLWPSVLFVMAIALMTATFLLGSSRSTTAADGWLKRYRLHDNVVLLAIPLAAVGFVAFVLFVQRTGGIDLGSLSAKRTTIGGVNIGDDYTSHGELRFLNSLSAIAFWIITAHFTQVRRKISALSSGGWVLAAFAGNAILLPVYSSSRTDALFVLIVAFGVSMIVRPRRFRFGTLALAVVAVIVLISTMTLLRASANMGTPTDTSIAALRDSAADTLVYNRNFGDMITSSHVINNVPQRIPFQDGKTIAMWALAPVPRAIWPDKPVINIGPVIGTYIYGSSRTGVPAGMVGDFYLNFGTGGVLAGAILVGLLLRTIENWRRRHVGDSSVAFALLYMPLSIDFAKNVTAKGIGAAAYNSTVQLVLTALCLFWVGRSIRARVGQGDLADAVSSERGQS